MTGQMTKYRKEDTVLYRVIADLVRKHSLGREMFNEILLSFKCDVLLALQF